MKLKNRTSTVSPSRSISQIEEILMAIGANEITKTANDGEVTGISFCVRMKEGPRLEYRLPARVERVFAELKKQDTLMRKRHRSNAAKTEELIQDQARRTAWKILLDWVGAQAAIIQLGQAQAEEVFLPYMLVGKGKVKTSLFIEMSSRGMDKFLLEGPQG